ncbi:hypothetical protein CEP51_016875, partial [Fusarium floridanum]
RWKHANNENIDTIICGGYVLRVERKRTKPVAASCRPGYWLTALPRYENPGLSSLWILNTGQGRPLQCLPLAGDRYSSEYIAPASTTSKNILEVPEDVRVSQISKDCRTTIMLRNIPNKVESLREGIAAVELRPAPADTQGRTAVRPPASVRRKDTLGNLEGESGLPSEAQKATDDGLEVSEQLRLCR